MSRDGKQALKEQPMEPIRKRYVVDESNRRVAVQIDLKTFEKIEDLLENSGLILAIHEGEGDEALSVDDADSFYGSLDKAP
jgi:hypothetical protein